MNHCYFNGTIIPVEDCTLHVSDLLIQRGYGVFDFFRVRSGEIPWLDDYIDRLFNSLSLSNIENPISRSDLKTALSDLMKQNGSQDAVFKVLVSGGRSEDLAHVSGKPDLIILHLPWKRHPEKNYRNGVNLISDLYVRPNPEIKTLFYFNNLRLQKQMEQLDAVDVLYHSDTISETSRANIFFVKKDNVFTPVTHILKGITRKQVLKIFREITLKDLEFKRIFEMEEVFITSTSRDITPVVSVDGRRIGKGVPGPVTREVQEAFRERGW
jgi:branched-chain amino acid aminotransferase